MKPTDETLIAIGLATTSLLGSLLARDPETFDALATELVFCLPESAQAEAIEALMMLPTKPGPTLKLVAGKDYEPC